MCFCLCPLADYSPLCWPHQSEWSPQALRICLPSQTTLKVLYIYMTRHYFLCFQGGGPLIPRLLILFFLLQSLLFPFFNLMVSLYQRSCDFPESCLAFGGILIWILELACLLFDPIDRFLLRCPIFEFLYLSVSWCRCRSPNRRLNLKTALRRCWSYFWRRCPC